MDLFEKVLTRQRDPGPVEHRLPKTIGTLTFAYWVAIAGALLTILSTLLAPQLNMENTGEGTRSLFFRSLPLVLVFIGTAFYVRKVMLARFLCAKRILPDAERQTMRMLWTPSKAIIHKYVELYSPSTGAQENDEDNGPTPVARAAVEKNLRRFDTRTWEAEVTVLLDPEDPDKSVLIDDGRFLYAGHILAKDEAPPALSKRLALLAGFVGLLLLAARLEAWFGGNMG